MQGGRGGFNTTQQRVVQRMCLFPHFCFENPQTPPEKTQERGGESSGAAQKTNPHPHHHNISVSKNMTENCQFVKFNGPELFMFTSATVKWETNAAHIQSNYPC